MSKQKKNLEIKMHQHRGKNGVVFGRLHPLDVVHDKRETQEWHEWTVKYDSKSN